MELLRALAVLAEFPRSDHAPVRSALGIAHEPDPADHTDLFAFQLPPYASIYVSEDGMLGGEARDRIAGFWRALHLTPPAEPDTLATLLALYATLDERERAERDAARSVLLQRARAALLWEHVAPWAFAYATKAREIAAPFYAEWAALLFDALAVAMANADVLGALPVHLHAIPPPADPGGDGEGFIGALLAPARSGLVLTRADLHRAGRELGLGLRQGERRYILRALLGQDASATFRWLAAEARAWERRHAAMEGVPRAVRDHWTARARATADSVAMLAAV